MMAKAAKSNGKTGGGGSSQERVAIKRITNGYLTVRSGLRDGKPFREERFSRQQPVASVAVPKRGAAPAKSTRRPSTRSDNEVGFLRGP
jgi:hypothetical protein